MINVVLALLVACGGPTPASIKIDGDQPAVHALDPVAVKAAQVLDAEGKALETQPAVTWTVTPETVAKLDGTNIVPVGNGDATITAAVGDIKAEYHLVVAVPDKVEVAGYMPGDAFPVGATKQLTASVTAAGAAVDGVTVTWASDQPAVATVDEKGMVTALAEGTSNITATSGTLNAAVTIGVQPAAPATADAAAAPK